MILYFQAGSKNRIAINTDDKTYCTDYFYLGLKSFIKISKESYNDIVYKIKRDNYKNDVEHNSI